MRNDVIIFADSFAMLCTPFTEHSAMPWAQYFTMYLHTMHAGTLQGKLFGVFCCLPATRGMVNRTTGDYTNTALYMDSGLALTTKKPFSGKGIRLTKL